MTYDMEYTIGAMFTRFTPNTKQGECAFNVIAAQNEGSGKILTAHLDSTLRQLRAAGYSVGRVMRQRTMSLDDIFDGEDALLAELMG